MIFSGLMIPFLGTTLGAGMVFFMKGSMNQKLEKMLLGFAAGVMIAASVWSLLIPSIEMTEQAGGIAWIPACVGLDSDKPEGPKTKLGKAAMLVLAVTLHNIPEGMAVGVTFAGVLIGNTGITLSGAFALALGIAIQNFPEGAIISMPLCSLGVSKKRAFLYGVLSGLVEPVGAMITILLTGIIVPFLPYFLSFAAGAMIYVVVEELIPESQMGEHTNIATIGVAVGFTLMMVLDVALG